MATATFDTLKFSNALKNAGVPHLQAEAEATVLAEALSVNFRDLTTKDDLKSIVTELRSDFKQMMSEFKSELRELEQRLNSRMDKIDAKLDQNTARLDAKIDQTSVRIEAKAEQNHSKNQSDIFLLKWMVGFCISLSMALVLRMVVSR